MFDLTGKTALITGATGTIGGRIARTLNAQGATVAISGTRRDVLDRAASGGRNGEVDDARADLEAVIAGRRDRRQHPASTGRSHRASPARA